MATAADVRRLRAANAELSSQAARDLSGLVGSLSLNNPAAARDSLLVAVPALTSTYGELSANVAAEWYDELRAAGPARGTFRAQPAPVVDAAAVQATVRWGAGGLWTGDAGSVISSLSNSFDKYVRQPGRDTISRNAGRDDTRWARVPAGTDTCAFCLVLASRGFAYRSEHTASRSLSGEDYHGNCHCEPVPDWSENPILEGYDPDALYAIYDEAVMAAGGDRAATESILAEIRSMGGVTDAHVTAS